MISAILKLADLVGLTSLPSKGNEQKLRQNIVRHEAQIGGQLFGPIEPGARREFFCLDEDNWIWYEEWILDGRRKFRITRYNILENVILKSQDNQVYRMISLDEAKRFSEAVENYQSQVASKVYQPILNSV